MSRRTFDSVSVGDTFGPTEVAVERETLVAYANASGDQNPIHQDEAFAKSVGLPDVIAHGMWTMGATSSVLVEWAGDPAAVTVTGVVKSADEETRSVLVDLTTVCGEDKVLGRCQARVALA